MFDETMEVFEAMVKDRGERWLYDNYIPTPGTYILLNIDDNFSVKNKFDIGKPDKESGEIQGRMNEDYSLVAFMDKNSKLITMNKAMDIGKIIHSNNFYSFFVKKESILAGKIEKENIEGYYDVLANPYKKYKKNKAKEIYSNVEKILGAVNTTELEKIHEWVQKSLFEFFEAKRDELHLDSKDYLKIFFVYSDDEKTKQAIKREGERYLRPNIFNNNDYNLDVNNEIYGLHNNNMGLNDKKPFLDNKTRKVSIPCAITMDKALIQYQFMEYLSSQAAKGNVNVYVDLDKKTINCISDKADKDGNNIESGLYFRIRQGKTEVEIYAAERITQYNCNLKELFNMKEIFELSEKAKEKYSALYGFKHKLNEVEMLVNEGLFSKYLICNYQTSVENLPKKMDNLVKHQLLICRDQLWKWFHNDEKQNVGIVLDKACKCFVRDAIENGYINKAAHQFNLWFSLMDYLNGNRRNEEHMSSVREQLQNHYYIKGEWDFESDDEYYYAVGQICRYILSLSKAKESKKALSMLRPILSVRDDKILKERIVLLAKKYDYRIEMRYMYARVLLARVLTYLPKGKVNDVMIMAGYVDENIVYQSKKEYDKEHNITDEVNSEELQGQ